MRRFRYAAYGILLAGLILGSPIRAMGQLQFNITADDSLSSNTAALAAFQRAAQHWSDIFSSPITINIDAAMVEDPNPFALGGTDVVPSGNYDDVNLNYDLVRNAMAARANQPGQAILAYLPTSAQITASVPTEIGAIFDPTRLALTRANQKALGLLDAQNPLSDAGMVFNSLAPWDYDRSDGIDSDKYDFETAVIHELGHVMGFMSDTDTFDYLYDPNIVRPLMDDATTVDLFRFSPWAPPSTFEEFTNYPRKLRPGELAVFWDLENHYPMSDGRLGGDGQQAGHWKDDNSFYIDPIEGTFVFGRYIGIMDPTLAMGQIEDITLADQRVFQLIGYDLPEPAMLPLIAAGLLMLTRNRVRISSAIYHQRS